MNDSRNRFLNEWAGFVTTAAFKGQLTGQPCQITQAFTIAGPRAGAIELLIGLQAGKVMRALVRDNCAALRQFVPWDFTGEPQAYMHGRALRLEAGWPDDLAETLIRLADLCDKPEGEGRWVAGKSECGATIIPGLNDRTPHFLVAGATGSGKSVALQSAVLQLSANPENEFILCDGKGGESLGALEHLPGVLGPCAIAGPDVRRALGYAVTQMHERGSNGNGRLVVVFDEFQELMEDSVISDLTRKIAAQGRSRHVHLLAATQHPTIDSLGHRSTRRNLTGKCALRVSDSDASRVAVGAKSPRADHLLGAGDCYLTGPGVCHRVQLAYVDDADISAGSQSGLPDWRFTRWPEYEPMRIGQDLPNVVGWHYTGDELAVSIVAASHNEGRPALVKRLVDAELKKPGSDRAARLLNLGRDTHTWLRQNGYAMCTMDDSLPDPQGVRITPAVF